MKAFDLGGLIAPGDALIIVPPFSTLRIPSLAAHVLQASGAARGFVVRVLYANAVFASVIGEQAYEKVCFGPLSMATLVGERIFSRAAYGLPPLGHHADEKIDRGELSELYGIEARAAQWADAVADAVVGRVQVVGCTATNQQTTASIALLDRIKKRDPSITTVIGGAACEGEMAQGIASISPSVDYVFSGEGDAGWPDILQRLRDGKRPDGRIIRGSPCTTLDDLPTPTYVEYNEQLERCGIDRSKSSLAFETSRGCWWGERHHCTFCGIHPDQMSYRTKSADRIITELEAILAENRDCKRLIVMDNTMPREHFKQLLPRIERDFPGLHIFWEQKPQLTLQQVLAIRRAGIVEVQAGIEGLTTSLLKLMNKGGQARHNIAFLRYARSANLRYVTWNLLYGLPGDSRADWSEVLELLPLIVHLFPPTGLRPMFIVRFSPYHERAAEHGVSNLRPIDSYRDTFPEQAENDRIAFFFDADYASGSRDSPDLMLRIDEVVRSWNERWNMEKDRPTLWLHPLANDLFVLRDTRGLQGTRPVQILDRNQASVALVTRPVEEMDSDSVQWAKKRKLGVVLDGCWVPLAIASPELLLDFERTSQSCALPAPSRAPAM